MPQKQGLYDPKEEKDACGVGMVSDLTGNPTHQTIIDGLEVLDNLDHRGARGCDEGTGDGAGILTAMPDRFFRRVFNDLPAPGQYAVGNAFFSRGTANINDVKRIFGEAATSMDGIRSVEWRLVPTNNEGLGQAAKTFEPHIEQVLVTADGPCLDEDVFNATLYRLRFRVVRLIKERLHQPFYMCSLSSRTMVYKGMLTCPQMHTYFPDLNEEDFQSHVALVHSRFSTNTFPSWDRAHPFRFLAHNGEINTIRGNTNR
jgi:glutamate synthase (ferredoxin)